MADAKRELSDNENMKRSRVNVLISAAVLLLFPLAFWLGSQHGSNPAELRHLKRRVAEIEVLNHMLADRFGDLLAGYGSDYGSDERRRLRDQLEFAGRERARAIERASLRKSKHDVALRRQELDALHDHLQRTADRSAFSVSRRRNSYPYIDVRGER